MPPIIPLIIVPAAIAPFVQAAIIIAVVTGIGLAIKAIVGPDVSSEPTATTGERRTVTVRDPVAPREIVYGKTRKGGTIVEFTTTTGDASELHLVIALAGHECEAIEEIYFGEELAFDASGTVQRKYSGKATLSKFLGTDTQAADSYLVSKVARWTPNHRLLGIAYIRVSLIFDRDIYPGVPNITAVVKGKKVYDPRVSASPADIAWTDNAALCQADYLNDGTYGLRAAYLTEIDDTELTAAANVCDELVNIPPVGSPAVTENRYTLNGVVSSAEEPGKNLERLLSASYGRANFIGGLWIVRPGAYDSPSETFDENDLRGNLVVQARVPRRTVFNAVRGTFVSAKNKYQPADFPPLTSATFEAQDNGERIWADITLPFTATETMAERIAKIHLFAMREQISVTYPCSLKAVRVRAGDVVAITNTRMGWSAKPFVVADWEFAVHEIEGAPVLGTTLSLRETSSAVYDITAGEQELIAAAPDTEFPPPTDVEFWATLIDGRGQFATSSVTSGFEAIIRPAQYRTWPGRAASPSLMSGFVYNPRTGHLNCEDQAGATGDNFDVFDSYVVTPVVNPSYETPELSISFDDVARMSAPVLAEKGPGETGSFTQAITADYRTDAGAYAGFVPLRVESVTARHFKFKVSYDTSAGAAMILKAFTPAVAKRLVVEKRTGVVIAVGGNSFGFAKPYHKTPSIGATMIGGSTLTPLLSGVSGSGFTLTVYDKADNDVGGTVNWRSEGV